MSVLFPKVNKPREWDYRPIYYDEEKEARKQKLARLRALREAEERKEAQAAGHQPDNARQTDGSPEEYIPTLHRGSFREAHDANRMHTPARQSRLTFWIALLAMLLFFVYLLS